MIDGEKAITCKKVSKKCVRKDENMMRKRREKKFLTVSFVTVFYVIVASDADSFLFFYFQFRGNDRCKRRRQKRKHLDHSRAHIDGWQLTLQRLKSKCTERWRAKSSRQRDITVPGEAVAVSRAFFRVRTARTFSPTTIDIGLRQSGRYDAV